MAGAISSVSCMGMIAIFLMTMMLKTVDAVLAWDCHGDKHLTAAVKFSDIIDEKLAKSLTKLGNEYPDEFAYKFMRTEGYIIDMQRDFFYVHQCKPVLAILVPQDKCYDRLPVTIKDKKLFISPWTHVVATKAKEISCNASDLQDYELEFNTYKVVPRPEGSLDPKEVDSETRDPNDPSPINVLKPSTKLTWKYTDLNNLGTSGLMDEKEFNRALDKYLHPISYQGYEGVISHRDTSNLIFNNPNAPEIPWYKMNDLSPVYVGIAALLIATVLCISLVMLVGRIKHGAALHFFRRGNRRRQMESNQDDPTIRLNKETIVYKI